MRIFVYSRARTQLPEVFMRWCVEVPGRFGYSWMLNEEYADSIEKWLGVKVPAGNRYSQITANDLSDSAFMVSVGGDGTFLEAVRMLRGLPMPIVGINMGRLGFLAHIRPGEAENVFADIAAGRYTVEKRTMLTVEGDFGDTLPEFPCALNEFTIYRHTADMIEVDTHIDGQRINVIRSDGVIACTPTGSTAYSLSAGGPIVTPDCACFVCVAVAPHNFSIRPLVIPDTAEITFEIHTRGREAMASLDNASFVVADGARFTIKKSEYSVFLMRVQNISFYDTLKDRMMWGIDKRDKWQETL